jgi:hypothetical protein
MVCAEKLFGRFACTSCCQELQYRTMPSTAADLQRRTSNSIPLLGFTFFVCVSLLLFLVPAFIIRPFRPQSAKGLQLAMAVRQVAPLWTVVAMIAAVIVAIALWRRVSKPGKALLVLGLVFGGAAAAMSRIDYFEWMFHPIPAPGFESPQAANLDDAEMVMAVRFGADSRAYPIRAMAYHHVVNDVVNGIPIAVTY